MFLEILRHEGPARLGIVHLEGKVQSPNLFSIDVGTGTLEHELYLRSHRSSSKREPAVMDYGSTREEKEIGRFGLLPDPHLGLRAPREIVEVGIERYLAFAQSYPEHGAVIAGSRYPDLRLRCAKAFEARGLVAVAEGSELLKDPRLLVEILPGVREAISPNTALYFPFAPPHLFPILAYMGVDLFDSAACLLEATRGGYMTPRGLLGLEELRELPCGCSACAKSDPEALIADKSMLLEHNFNSALTALQEVREALRLKRFRNLVEEKAGANIESAAALRLLDLENEGFLERYTPTC